MSNLKIIVLLGFLAIFSCKDNKPKGLDTKLIASEYYKGVVKIIMFDEGLEKQKPGSGYLSRGSGFIVTEDGYVFTNRHVVETAVKGYIDYDYYVGKTKKSNLTVYSRDIANDKTLSKVYRVAHTTPLIQIFNGKNENDYELYKAEVIAIGAGAFDGALLKIISDIDNNPIAEKFKSLPIGNSDTVSQGEKLCVFGFPAQYQGGSEMLMKDMSTLSVGIMSGHDYVFNADYGYIKTDAEIHGGNSGGPVFDENNKVIGIATAKGNKTGIGLVGGVNGMYYISAVSSDAHKKLIASGLTLPERSASINTVKGTKQEVMSATEINNLIAARVKKENDKKTTSNKTSDYYLKSKIFFSNVSMAQNNNSIPNLSKRYTRFRIDSKNNSIWVYVENTPYTLNTKKFKVYTDKKDTYGIYKKYKDFNVSNVISYAKVSHFSYAFKDVGKYRMRIYSNEGKYINTAYFETVAQ